MRKFELKLPNLKKEVFCATPFIPQTIAMTNENSVSHAKSVQVVLANHTLWRYYKSHCTMVTVWPRLSWTWR